MHVVCDSVTKKQKKPMRAPCKKTRRAAATMVFEKRVGGSKKKKDLQKTRQVTIIKNNTNGERKTRKKIYTILMPDIARIRVVVTFSTYYIIIQAGRLDCTNHLAVSVYIYYCVSTSM